jgi:hypothetical protein
LWKRRHNIGSIVITLAFKRMGACVDRPTLDELELHKAHDQTSHDHHFLPLPRLSSSRDTLKADPSKLKSEVEKLQGKLDKYRARLESLTEETSQVPSLRFEIKKGSGIGTDTGCLSSLKTTVIARLHPNGLDICQTKPSKPCIPEWFEYFSISEALESYTHLRFDVYRNDSLFGYVVISLDKLQDQLMVCKWLPVLEAVDKAELMVRVQLFIDERRLLQRLIEECTHLLQVVAELNP